MTDELVEFMLLVVLMLVGLLLASYLHHCREIRRKLSKHRPDMQVLNREPYSAQDAYNRRLRRQS